MRREHERSAILLIHFCKNMLLIALIVFATNEHTTFDSTQNFWTRTKRFKAGLKFTFVGPWEFQVSICDFKRQSFFFFFLSEIFTWREQERRKMSLMIPSTHLLLIALIVGATNERTTIDNSWNLWMQFRQLVRFVSKLWLPMQIQQLASLFLWAFVGL